MSAYPGVNKSTDLQIAVYRRDGNTKLGRITPPRKPSLWEVPDNASRKSLLHPLSRRCRKTAYTRAHQQDPVLGRYRANEPFANRRRPLRFRRPEAAHPAMASIGSATTIRRETGHSDRGQVQVPQPDLRACRGAPDAEVHYFSGRNTGRLRG